LIYRRNGIAELVQVYEAVGKSDKARAWQRELQDSGTAKDSASGTR
jgi:hypothetical protein